jgi:hypothetical protein
MDIILETNNLFVKIILTCVFGEDLSELELDYIEHSKITKRTIPYALRYIMQNLAER